ncbi:MAG: isoaspartyl peptidase/L-asparaginase, partial [Phycisphaerales bacterium]
MQHHLTRRAFLASTTAVAASSGALAQLGAGQADRREQEGADDLRKKSRAPIAIASANGLAATTRAYDMLGRNADPLDAAVAGVKIVEDDPDDMTVGLGGLPNEEGIVELDASVMHGPTHRAGAVASLRNIRNPAAVAREVARRTDHVLLVGEGALKFARRMGFQEENLLTDKAREAWLRWRSTLNRDDDWLEADEFDLPEGAEGNGQRAAGGPHVEWRNGIPFTTGTIHLSALDANSNLAGCTTTSGLSWKLPGRGGDSPIIGGGLYTDSDAGSPGAPG